MSTLVRNLIRPAIGSALIGVAVVIIRKIFGRHDQPHAPGDGVAVGKDEGPVRTAGPDSMRTRPNQWSREDEASDESFPASDPPGQGVG